MWKRCSMGFARLRHEVPLQVLAAVRPLGGQEGDENPSKEETGCMEKEVVWRKGGERAGS